MNNIFRVVHTRYLDKALPSDQVVSDFIKQDAGLSDEDASACWGVISENMRFAGLLIKEGGRDVVVARQNASPVTRREPAIQSPQEQANADQGATDSSAVHINSSFTRMPQAEFHFNVQIHLPNDAAPEIYDAIFAGIAKNLLQRKA
jgi:hypothetical protein